MYNTCELNITLQTSWKPAWNWFVTAALYKTIVCHVIDWLFNKETAFAFQPSSFV